MAFSKRVALHDKITIDGTDYSNAFNEFGFSSAHTDEDLSGFSESGTDELSPGRTAQAFSGRMFLTEEVISAIWPMHITRDEVLLDYQPNGLQDPSAPHWQANVTINEFSPENRRGSPATFPFSATPADELGIYLLGT